MVASNLDDVFHIVFIATDKNRTLNEEFDFFFMGGGKVRGPNSLIFGRRRVCGYENDVEHII